MCEHELTTLIIRCQHGERAPLIVLWDAVQPIVLKTAAAFLENSQSVGGYMFDDLCQEGYLALVITIETFSAGPNANFYGLFKTILIHRFARCTNRSTCKRPKVLDCAASLDAPLTDSANSGVLRGIIPDGKDDIGLIIHRIWLEDLRSALEQALSCIPKEQAAALWRRCQGEYLSPQEQRLAHIALNKLKRKQSTYQYLQRFVCNLV